MRQTAVIVFLFTSFIVGCSGAGPTAAPGGPTLAPGQPTVAPGQPTPAGAPPPVGAQVTVILTGGPDAGTYTGGENPNCSFGLIPGAWGTQYSTDAAGAGQLSSVQLISPVGTDSDATFTMTITIGKLFEGNDYEVSESSGGTGSAQVTDNGTTAVIHATGTTSDGVGIDATINCPSVFRA